MIVSIINTHAMQKLLKEAINFDLIAIPFPYPYWIEHQPNSKWSDRLLLVNNPVIIGGYILISLNTIYAIRSYVRLWNDYSAATDTKWKCLHGFFSPSRIWLASRSAVNSKVTSGDLAIADLISFTILNKAHNRLCNITDHIGLRI